MTASECVIHFRVDERHVNNDSTVTHTARCTGQSGASHLSTEGVASRDE